MALGFSHPFGLPTAQTSPGHPSLVSFSDCSLRVPPTSVCAPCLPRGQSGLGPSWVGRCLTEAVGTPCCAGRPRVPHSALPSPLCPGHWAEAPGSRDGRGAQRSQALSWKWHPLLSGRLPQLPCLCLIQVSGAVLSPSQVHGGESHSGQLCCS